MHVVHETARYRLHAQPTLTVSPYASKAEGRPFVVAFVACGGKPGNYVSILRPLVVDGAGK